MTSIIKADNISTVSGSGNITIPTGVKLIGTDNSSIVAPGHVLQTVQSKWYGNHDTSSTSFVSVDDSQVNITPKYANSQFLIRYALHQYCRNNTQHGLKPYFYVPSIGSWSALTSNSTFNEIVRVANGSTNLVIWSMQHFEFLVGVPGNGTEQVSFKIYHRTADANYSVRINDNGPGSSITVQEIAQ
tara:strand:+ start:597 stop:1157 length:561 start_codon:yes stop_codon:yes gene_type:complete